MIALVDEIAVKTVATVKSMAVDEYDLGRHQNINNILISRTEFGAPAEFIVIWSDNGISGFDGPYDVYPALRRAMRKAGALDFFGCLKKSALQYAKDY